MNETDIKEFVKNVPLSYCDYCGREYADEINGNRRNFNGEVFYVCHPCYSKVCIVIKNDINSKGFRQDNIKKLIAKSKGANHDEI
jgi:transposase-like protein